MEDDLTEGEYNVDFKEVLNHKKLFAVTRLLAASLQQTPYIHPGLFIKDLTDTDLQLLLDHIEPEDNSFENVMVIALMLTVGEGIAATNKQIHRSINSLIVMLISESLHRKGLVKVHHRNFSFGEDADTKIVLEKINGIDYRAYLDRLEDGEGA